MSETQEQSQQVGTDAAHPAINVNYDKNLDTKEFKFYFRKDELGNKRPQVELKLLVPSVEGIVRIMERGGKELELLLDTVADVIGEQARSIVDEQANSSQENFPMDKVTWEFIANLEKAARRGGGIPKEIWEAFGKDYTEIMPALTGKTPEQVGNAVKILLNKFAAVKTNKPVLNRLKEQLSIYVSNSPNADQFTDCVEFLLNKADTLLNMSEADLLANL